MKKKHSVQHLIKKNFFLTNAWTFRVWYSWKKSTSLVLNDKRAIF